MKKTGQELARQAQRPGDEEAYDLLYVGYESKAVVIVPLVCRAEVERYSCRASIKALQRIMQ